MTVAFTDTGRQLFQSLAARIVRSSAVRPRLAVFVDGAFVHWWGLPEAWATSPPAEYYFGGLPDDRARALADRLTAEALHCPRDAAWAVQIDVPPVPAPGPLRPALLTPAELPGRWEQDQPSRRSGGSRLDVCGGDGASVEFRADAQASFGRDRTNVGLYHGVATFEPGEAVAIMAALQSFPVPCVWESPEGSRFATSHAPDSWGPLRWRARPLAVPELGEQSVALHLTFDSLVDGGTYVLVWRRETAMVWLAMTVIGEAPPHQNGLGQQDLDELFGIARQADQRLVAPRDR